MDSEKSIISSKSLSLIEKTKHRVIHDIDPDFFPTDSSSTARHILEELLKIISTAPLPPSVCPHTLYKFLIELQSLVDDVELSTSDHIIWPIVSYWDGVWNDFFGTDGIQVFYSLTKEHNYSIFSYSKRLMVYLPSILPIKKVGKLLVQKETEKREEIDALLEKKGVYCLRLASIEDENIPLYANIAHEFGHTIYYYLQSELMLEWARYFGSFWARINGDFKKKDKINTDKVKHGLSCILVKFSEELFADLIGSLLVGPAFFLSLYEMSWGRDKSLWDAKLASEISETRAHPGFRFRLECIAKYANISDFNKQLQEELLKLNIGDILDNISVIYDIQTVTDMDRISVSQQYENESRIIESIINDNFQEIIGIYRNFINACFKIIETKYNEIIRKTKVAPADVAELLLRLKNNILPNIIPKKPITDDNILGRPASFQNILVASALYRIVLLLTRSHESKPNKDNLYDDINNWTVPSSR